MAELFSNIFFAGNRIPPVALISLCLCLGLALGSLAYPVVFMNLAVDGSGWFKAAMGRWVVIASSLFALLCIGISLSPLGRIRLGRDDERPEFSTLAWWSMLFAAGMGAGLLYWGGAEPLSHLLKPPPLPTGMQADGIQRSAIVVSYLHWALHPWGIYTAGALCIAYFSFRKGHSMLSSSPLKATLPDHRVSRVLQGAIDVFAVLSIAFGLAAALSQGVMQIEAGLKTIGASPTGSRMTAYSLIVLVLATTYLLSSTTGLRKGIKWLSEINILVTILLALYVMAVGPFHQIMATLITGVEDYIRHLPELSFGLLEDAEGQTGWSETWTVTYFLSWIAWVPFVGVFIARISRGRTIREFVFAVLLIPSLFTFLWFAVFGGAAFYENTHGVAGLAQQASENVSDALFALFAAFPYERALSVAAIFLAFIFLVTSADSASYVLGMLTADGTRTPTISSRVFWGVVIALMTMGTLLSGKGVHSVRALFSLGAIPVLFIMILQMACLVWVLGRSRNTPGFAVREQPA